MPDQQKQGGNSQTLWVQLSELEYSVVELSQGVAKVIKFRLLNDTIRIGDVLCILEGGDIRFHGMIYAIDADGWAVATDPHGSTIPAAVQ